MTAEPINTMTGNRPQPPGAGPAAAPTGVAGIHLRCAPSAERRGDQRSGSAAPVPRWLLVEQPGGWGRDALRESGVDAAVAQALARRAAAAGTRVVLIRRTGRGAPAGTRSWAYVDSRPGREGVWWGTYQHYHDLLDVPLDHPSGPLSRDPIYLVCTHGRHDPCCAIRGRPVAGGLAAVRPDQTWECSHIGGDRFAANLVALPHGYYYGHVTPAAAVALAGDYESGQVEPRLLRGRSSLAAPVQAAQQHARLALGERGVDALAPLEVRALPTETWRVRLEHPDGRVSVLVRAERAPAVRLTCSAGRPETTRVFRLVELELPGRVAPAERPAPEDCRP